MSKREYTVIAYEAEEGGYWTQVPELPGTGSQGQTLEEALENTREAIALMVEHLRAKGQRLPAASPIITKVTVAA